MHYLARLLLLLQHLDCLLVRGKFRTRALLAQPGLAPVVQRQPVQGARQFRAPVRSRSQVVLIVAVGPLRGIPYHVALLGRPLWLCMEGPQLGDAPIFPAVRACLGRQRGHVVLVDSVHGSRGALSSNIIRGSARCAASHASSGNEPWGAEQHPCVTAGSFGRPNEAHLEPSCFKFTSAVWYK